MRRMFSEKQIKSFIEKATTDKANVIKIDSSTDVTTMFDKVKVGDMINQNDTRLYIVGGTNYEDAISLFFIDYESDKIGYWYYEKENNNWVYNEDVSFEIQKTPGLYLRHLYMAGPGYHWYFLTNNNLPLQLPYQSFDELNDAIRQRAISTITNEKGSLVQYDDSDNFFTEIVIDGGEIMASPLDDFSVEEVEETITKIA